MNQETVLVMEPGNTEHFGTSTKPYSKMVAGIYSTKPGMVGKRAASANANSEIPMTMIGIVPTKVTTQNGSIETGDLLVTSDTPGYAMKGTDTGRMLGAVVGKALGTLTKVKGSSTCSLHFNRQKLRVLPTTSSRSLFQTIRPCRFPSMSSR